MDKAPGKIQINAGIYKGTVLKVPDAVVRPTPLMLRQALFNSLHLYLQEGPFLDLFAGSGAMGLEALSRGAPACTLVENGAAELSALRQSLGKMGLDHSGAVTLLALDINKALALLARQQNLFHFIFIDPPYQMWEQGASLPWLSGLAALLDSTGQVICQRDKIQQQVHIPGLELTTTRTYGRNALDFYSFPDENNHD